MRCNEQSCIQTFVYKLGLFGCEVNSWCVSGPRKVRGTPSGLAARLKGGVGLRKKRRQLSGKPSVFRKNWFAFRTSRVRGLVRFRISRQLGLEDSRVSTADRRSAHPAPGCARERV